MNKADESKKVDARGIAGNLFQEFKKQEKAGCGREENKAMLLGNFRKNPRVKV